MIKDKIFFEFNGESCEKYGIYNVNIDESSMLTELLTASREVTTQRNLYNEDIITKIADTPLEFTLSFAFLDGWENLKPNGGKWTFTDIVRWLKQPTYKELIFKSSLVGAQTIEKTIVGRDAFNAPIPEDPFKDVVISEDLIKVEAIFSDDINYIHNGLRQGYLTLNVKCKNPYFYSGITKVLKVDNSEDTGVKIIDVWNNGAYKTEPIIEVEINPDEFADKRANSFSLSMKINEELKAINIPKTAPHTSTLIIEGSMEHGDTIIIGEKTYTINTDILVENDSSLNLNNPFVLDEKEAGAIAEANTTAQAEIIFKEPVIENGEVVSPGVRKGDTITIDGKTFEFCYRDRDVTPGNYEIVLPDMVNDNFLENGIEFEKLYSTGGTISKESKITLSIVDATNQEEKQFIFTPVIATNEDSLVLSKESSEKIKNYANVYSSNWDITNREGVIDNSSGQYFLVQLLTNTDPNNFQGPFYIAKCVNLQALRLEFKLYTINPAYVPTYNGNYYLPDIKHYMTELGDSFDTTFLKPASYEELRDKKITKVRLFKLFEGVHSRYFDSEDPLSNTMNPNLMQDTTSFWKNMNKRVEDVKDGRRKGTSTDTLYSTDGIPLFVSTDKKEEVVNRTFNSYRLKSGISRYQLAAQSDTSYGDTIPYFIELPEVTDYYLDYSFIIEDIVAREMSDGSPLYSNGMLRYFRYAQDNYYSIEDITENLKQLFKNNFNRWYEIADSENRPVTINKGLMNFCSITPEGEFQTDYKTTLNYRSGYNFWGVENKHNEPVAYSFNVPNYHFPSNKEGRINFTKFWYAIPITGFSSGWSLDYESEIQNEVISADNEYRVVYSGLDDFIENLAEAINFTGSSKNYNKTFKCNLTGALAYGCAGEYFKAKKVGKTLEILTVGTVDSLEEKNVFITIENINTLDTAILKNKGNAFKEQESLSELVTGVRSSVAAKAFTEQAPLVLGKDRVIIEEPLLIDSTFYSVNVKSRYSGHIGNGIDCSVIGDGLRVSTNEGSPIGYLSGGADVSLKNLTERIYREINNDYRATKDDDGQITISVPVEKNMGQILTKVNSLRSRFNNPFLRGGHLGLPEDRPLHLKIDCRNKKVMVVEGDMTNERDAFNYIDLTTFDYPTLAPGHNEIRVKGVYKLTLKYEEKIR